MNRPTHKTEGVNRTKTVRVYPFVFTVEVPCKEVRTPLNSITSNEERDEETCYGYCNEYQPHAVKRMFDHKNEILYDMRWDEAGNLGQVSIAKPGEMFEAGRFLFWTEDNRMHAAVDDKYYSYYAYDHSGERRLKLTGDNKLLDVNADFMATYTLLNEPTLYPSAYMVLTNKGYTKHYYAGTERVAARLGGGGLDALQHVIANDDELRWKADKLFKQSLDHVNHRVLNENNLDCIMHNEFARDEFGKRIDGIPYQVRSDVKVDNWQFKEMVNSMLDDPNHGLEKDVYFYHSDHLGSASWITDFGGVAVQHIQYLPYGEPYINQHPFGYSERFTFTGKERDPETGFSYFGARYYDPDITCLWLSPDPLSDKYPGISPYAYCAWNPVRLVDPDGRDTIFSFACRTNNIYYNGKNLSLLKSMRNLGNSPLIIAVAMHGTSTKIEAPMTTSDKTTTLVPADAFAQKIKNGAYGSFLYIDNCRAKKKTVIILYSCRTGSGDHCFGQQLSAQLESAIVIAPTGYIWAGINKKGETTIDNRDAIPNGDGRSRKGDAREWRIFYKGRLITSFNNTPPQKWINSQGGLTKFINSILNQNEQNQ